MKTFIITLLSSFLLLNGLKGQSATEKTYGTQYADEIVSAITLTDSSTIYLMNKSHQQLSAISIFKTGKDNLPKWAKTTGFFYNKINSVIQTYDGNIAFAGYVPRSNQYSGEYKNALVAKMDTAGNILWNRMFRLGYSTEATSIIQLPDSSLFIIGTGDEQSEPFYRIVAIHLDKNGNEIKSYSYFQSNYNFASDVIFCHDSTILIVGENRSDDSKLLLANFNMSGELQWNKVLSTGSDPQFIGAKVITTDASNNYYIAGNQLNSIFYMKLNNDFDIEWSNSYGKPEITFPGAVGIQCLNDSVIIINANILDKNVWTAFPRPASDIVIISINQHGDTLWTSAVGSKADDYAFSSRLSDSVLIISGSTYGFATEGEYDGYQINYVLGKSTCNTTSLDWMTDTVEFEESASIEMGSELIAVDSTIIWMADTIGFHNACICHPPSALFNWYVNFLGLGIATNLSVWATDWTWNIGSGQQSEEFHIEFVGDNINLCLSVENECGSDEYCEIVFGGVAVSAINQISLEAFPVPSSDKVQLQFEHIGGNPDIRIFDATGKQVGIFPRYTQNSLTLSKQDTGSGLFFVVFMLDSKVIAMKKIIFE
jgi:hypothetical protein